MNNIFLIVGCSGSGKTTITEQLEQKYGLKSIQSYTTRPPRYDGETGHIFISNEEKNRFIFGFANGQPLLYISNVEIVYKKSAILTDNTFMIFPLTRLYRWVISASLFRALSLPPCAIHSVSMTSCHGLVSPCFLSSCS